MKKYIQLFIIILLAATLAQPNTYAQDNGKTGNVFTISTYKVQFHNLDTVLEHWKEYTDKVLKQNDHIISSRVFTHMYGPDWSLVMINEYESMAAIEQAYVRNQELNKEAFPDEEKSEEINNMLSSMMRGHTDAIVMEDESLRK
jgi:hypothetical protein